MSRQEVFVCGNHELPLHFGISFLFKGYVTKELCMSMDSSIVGAREISLLAQSPSFRTIRLGISRLDTKGVLKEGSIERTII